MTITRSSFKGVERRAANSASTGANEPFPDGPGLPGDETTGAGMGSSKVKRQSGKVAGAPSSLTEGGGALGRTSGGP